jgi:uncharacterized protein YbbC (DUF1343 family)
MPAQSTAVVYPGMVLTEATNLSEARGTTLPFELTGAPWLKNNEIVNYLEEMDLPGCRFRIHNYIPTFHKYAGEYCNGIQVHITDISTFRPVYTTMALYMAILHTSPEKFRFLDPPYEYEDILMPFDILAGDDGSRKCLAQNRSLKEESGRWSEEINRFKYGFNQIKLY